MVERLNGLVSSVGWNQPYRHGEVPTQFAAAAVSLSSMGVVDNLIGGKAEPGETEPHHHQLTVTETELTFPAKAYLRDETEGRGLNETFLDEFSEYAMLKHGESSHYYY